MIKWFKRFFCKHKNTKLTHVDNRTMIPKTRVCLDCDIEQSAQIVWVSKEKKKVFLNWIN